ncbi:MAG: methyl-accepting chemotaxis protein [Butyrivibrio sp.]|nr:methyl-accepting chemotaxis protein [Butyrivibrio sp.]
MSSETTTMNTNPKKIKKLSTKLIKFIIPLFAVGVAVMLAVLATFISSVIRNLLYTSLEQQVNSDAGQINKQLNSIFYYLNGVGDTIETVKFKNDEEIKEYMATSLGRYDIIPTGTYLTLNDGAYIDPSGWDPGKDTRESAWYKQGIGYDNKFYYYYDVPYFDSDTGELCATVVRHLHLPDGREGVIASDLFMAAAQEYLNGISIYETGHAMMLTDEGLILSYPVADVCGQNVADVANDKLLTSIYGMVTSGQDGEVQKIKGNDGTYYAVMQTVSGTNWKVVDYANSASVLKSITYMIIVLAIIVVVLLIVLAAVFALLVGKLIRRPIKDLTDNIENIANGDFTNDINNSGDDEIAFMNSSMNGFIGNMRGTIKDIQNATRQLEEDSSRSRDTSELLSQEADEQSQSMEQILDNMESMSSAVAEVAENATTLAQTVSELTDAEQNIESSMSVLVDKAATGQKDMSAVSSEMNNIVASMNDMNEAVQSVDDAANQINQIVDMINSIASQTNLLSLNASIEAARAGEAGKGFAVVATEIGQLANNSSDATKQIAEIIEGMGEKVRDLATKSETNTNLINSSAESINAAADTFMQISNDLNEANKTLIEMADKMNSVNDVATNMASVSEEQSASTQEITETVNRLTQSSRKVADSSREVSEAAGSVASSADQISENIKFFKIGE